MIEVKEILGDAASKLELDKRGDKSMISDFFRGLDHAITDLSREFPVLRDSTTLTTVSGQGTYTFPTTKRQIQILNITWPSTWIYPLEEVEYQTMQDLKRVINAADTDPPPYTLSTSQPSYWCKYFTEDPYIELQDDSTITAGLSIVVDYEYVYTSKINDSSATIPIGREYQKYLTYYVIRDLSPKYKPDYYKVADKELVEEYDKLVRLRKRRSFVGTQYRPFLKW